MKPLLLLLLLVPARSFAFSAQSGLRPWMKPIDPCAVRNGFPNSTDDTIPADTTDLFRAIRIEDSLLFDVGFNTCNVAQIDSLISDNFEFYHDEAGVTLSKPEFLANIRDGLCKLPYKPRRQLMEGTMRVFPLRKKGVLYGAVQTGRHAFYAKEKEKPEYLTSTAAFSHLWLLEGGRWKLSRVFSYDHQVPKSLGN